MQCVLLIITAFSAALATDYCDPKLCGSSKHIACGHNGAFAADCKDPVELKLTKNIRNLIVDAHNTVRNRVAGGRLAFRPACRMATMQWDDELAELAALNAKQCEMRHDACHNTDAFKYSGQNLAWITFYNTPNATKLSLQSVDMWYNENKNTKMEYINKYPSNYRGPTIGHFTVMVVDRNIRVGCAASTYKDSGDNAFLFVCNYARTNMISSRIYKSCSVAASECKTGTNPKYSSLCSITEEYIID